MGLKSKIGVARDMTRKIVKLRPFLLPMGYLFGNRLGQWALEYSFLLIQYLMGIGAGAGANKSGEAGVLRKLKSSGLESYCIFDVGANQGEFLELILSNMNGRHTRVHCFEPAKVSFSLLASRFGDLSNVFLNNFALAQEQGEFTLYYDKPGSGLASLTKRNLDHLNISFDESEQVRVDTVDDYCESNGVDNINLLKIDVEGHEMDVLRGAKRMLSRSAVDMISFEFGCNVDTRTYLRDFFQFFKKLNMAIFRNTPSGYLYPLPTYSENYEQFRTTNFLAVNQRLL